MILGWLDGGNPRRATTFLSSRLLATAVRNWARAVLRIREHRMDLQIPMYQVATVLNVGSTDPPDRGMTVDAADLGSQPLRGFARAGDPNSDLIQIGRASCRERVYVLV